MTLPHSSSRHNSRHPREISYVTDNDRDAEALRRQTEMPVRVQHRKSLKLRGHLQVIAEQVSVQTLEASERLDAQEAERGV
jgi:hypothetical protein